MVLLRPRKHSPLFHVKPAFTNSHHRSDSLKARLQAFTLVVTVAGPQQPPLCHKLACAHRPCIAANSGLAAWLAVPADLTRRPLPGEHKEELLLGGRWQSCLAQLPREEGRRHRSALSGPLPPWTGLRAAPPGAAPSANWSRSTKPMPHRGHLVIS